MQMQQLATDGGRTQLAVRTYEPVGAPRASIVIGGAMGVRQSFYEPFARWLAQQGLRVWTFDYRGSGDSRGNAPLRGFKADLLDWACDYEAVIDAAKAALPGQPLYLLGHSLGAQLPGFLQRPGQVDGLVSIAAGSGYWRENAPKLKRSILYFWFVLVPLVTRLCGYFPGRRLKKVGDLPRGVILQWRRWCLNPRYSVGAEGEAALRSYGRVRFPVLALSMTDDELMTLAGTESLVSFYAGAPSAVERIAPADVQARRIGHFGFFREQFSQSLWPSTLDKLHRLASLTALQHANVPHTTA
ncbi:alpha/beta fold hydrolase [Variovorax sp. Varisp85]|jgi:predicted alpha/beta hydrolase|uniref:alpha/beta hydrolase family protein n=1 Tax=unclassified Variovorax TaxID=663243 RepID=UPI0002712F3D|nr:alpha/beta fold hydrolase [Variovorax sp. CF313]EJL74081.1 putative alpha/beta hydrolase [Variovorax sp. CF313]